MKIAAAQIACAPGDLEANLGTIHDFAARAKDNGTEMIVFPEMIDTGYSMPVVQKHATAWNEGAVPRLQKMARQLSLAVITGVSDRDGPRIHNSQVFIDAYGVIVAAASADREELIVAEISEEVIKSVRSHMAVFDHRRRDLY